jgi:two-component system NtrC family sensor kinase
LLTAATHRTDRLHGFEAGAVDYVTKPFDPEELLARVRSQLKLRDMALRLHESEKLAALGTLSAGLAHELRNPANAIVNAVEPLAELLPSELRAPETAVAQLLDVLRDCAQQVAILSRQLLGFKRSGELERHPVAVSDLIARALRLVQQSLKNIELEQDGTYDGAITCAAPLLVQVLTNLLENAAHAAGAGGRVRLSTRATSELLIIEVSDSGPGVPRELRERIFEPFFTTKPPGVGTGLGLTTAREIAIRHGGMLEVRDLPRGSVFHLELPLRPAAVVEAAVHHHPGVAS